MSFDLYMILDKIGYRRDSATDLDTAWKVADLMAEKYPDIGPFTVHRYVPVPRPVPPRPTDTISGVAGCYFKGGKLRNNFYGEMLLSGGDNFEAAAELWKKHKQWIADGGKDDE